jgi:Cu-Zn family superoxide dismutase
MRHAFLTSLVVSSVLFSLTLTSSAKSAKVKVEISDSLGHSIGLVTIKPAATGVSLQLNLRSLPPGVHAIHFHQNPVCDAPTFKGAGGHFNPDGKQHGLNNPQGHHAGDMQNFTADANGKVKTTVSDPDVTLSDGTHSLFSNGGTAIVIHEKADDMMTDPSGNSGGRIACGVVKR